MTVLVAENNDCSFSSHDNLRIIDGGVSLACPSCKSDLQKVTDGHHCDACSVIYKDDNNIHCLMPDSYNDNDESNYYDRFDAPEGAKAYEERHKTNVFHRVRTALEKKLLKKMLAVKKTTPVALNLPAGGGRLSAVIEKNVNVLIEADISKGQLFFNQQRIWQKPRVFMQVNAFHIPLQDNDVDVTTCIRLSHHLDTVIDRELLLAELFRVTNKYLIFSYNSDNSIKMKLRRLRGKKNNYKTMSEQSLEKVAAANGFKVMRNKRVIPFGQHRYVLFEKL